MNDQAMHQLDELKKKLIQIESMVISAKTSIEKFEREYVRTDYTQIDGISGWYDGKTMQAEDGKAYEVPDNYAAKSKLVYGDKLKLVEENGKKLFKQIDPVERLKVEGILTKKEGEWYLLCDRGSYKVSDTAAEYQGAVLNSEVTAFLPKDNLSTPFATIDIVKVLIENVKKEEKAVVKKEPEIKKDKIVKKPIEKKKSVKPSTSPNKPKDKEAERPAVEKKTISLDDDDLV